MLVDAHTHVVSSDPDSYPLTPAALPGSWYLQSPCSAEGLLDELASVLERFPDAAVSLASQSAVSEPGLQPQTVRRVSVWPSTLTTWPLTKRAASELKNTTMAAISAGSTSVRIDTCST